MGEKIIIIEDDKGVRFFLEEALKGEGYAVLSSESYENASLKIDKTTDLIIMDIKLPGLDGLSAIAMIKKKTDAPIIIVTAFGTKKNAMEAIERGAADFFVKPIALEELKVMVKRVLQRKDLTREIERVKRGTISNIEFHGIVGKSRAMQGIFKTIEKIAEKNLSVLITGETGVGKEVVAKAIHRLSKRKGDCSIVNCASIPDTLLESELFGFERGAFTGAVQQKPGKFEVADGGTIILDEIGEMTPYLQAKLLRVIDTKEIERLGGIKKRKVDVKIMATTNRVMETEIKAGRFREDLYHRLSQIHISIPPLRERKEDLDALIEHCLIDVSREQGTFYNIDPLAKDTLLNYSWPGNVRELINVVKRAAIMCDKGLITADDIPLHIKGDYSSIDMHHSDTSLDSAISELEKRMIMNALSRTKGQQSGAAKLLGISERSMWYRVKKYAIDV